MGHRRGIFNDLAINDTNLGVYNSNITKKRQNHQKVSKLKGFMISKGLLLTKFKSLLLHFVDIPIRFFRYFVIQGFGVF